MSNSWPSLLPEGQISNYGYQRQDMVIRTEMDTGYTRMRRRFSDAPATASISWVMTGPQFAYFEGWYLHTIEGGASAFTTSINVGAGGCVSHECRFLSPYSVELIRDDLYRISASLMVTRLSVLSGDTIAVIDEYGDVTSYWAFIDIMDTHVNVELPASEMGA